MTAVPFGLWAFFWWNGLGAQIIGMLAGVANWGEAHKRGKFIWWRLLLSGFVWYFDAWVAVLAWRYGSDPAWLAFWVAAAGGTLATGLLGSLAYHTGWFKR